MFHCIDIYSRVTADGQNNPNMTNLAIKGIIAVQAMAEISDALGNNGDATSYKVTISISWM